MIEICNCDELPVVVIQDSSVCPSCGPMPPAGSSFIIRRQSSSALNLLDKSEGQAVRSSEASSILSSSPEAPTLFDHWMERDSKEFPGYLLEMKCD